MENENNAQGEDYDFDNIDDEDFSEDIPPSEGSVVKFLLKQLHIGMSLSQITLPTFILEPRSTLERFTDWMAHADILRKIKDEPDPYYRCLHLCTWIVSGFHLGSLRPTKPYNSVVGEVYRSVLVDNDNNIIGQYIAEQVSHHPPISAFHYRDPVGGVVIWGHTEMRSKFLYNSIAALMDHENTRVNLEIPSLGETYEFNFPNMYGRGILFGKMRMEICGQVRVMCKRTGISGRIDFLEKPLFRKRYNRFKGYVSCANSQTPTILFSGRWTAFMKCVDNRSGRTMITFDVRRVVPLRIVSPPIEDQCEFESQYIWRCVSHYIRAKDSVNATVHKSAIEEKQRREREFFKENGIEWELQLFHFDMRQNRYVPNNLELNPRVAGQNEHMTMPNRFNIPRPVQLAMQSGATVSFERIQRDTEKNIETDHPFVFGDEEEERGL